MVCENVLVFRVLRREGSLCCVLINGLGSDVDVSVLKIGDTRRLATTVGLYMGLFLMDDRMMMDDEMI